MIEIEVIRAMAARFQRSPGQVNGLFECDAEIVHIGGKAWGLTLDDFSPQEDRFSLDDPLTLGANLATATLSDLLAAGVEPAFYLHAVSLPPDVPASVVTGLSEGIRRVLEPAGCYLCGGDTGIAVPWRYCGFAMGPVAAPRPLLRRLPERPQSLWVTGSFGDANLAALQGAPPPAFEMRLREARPLWSHATGCMDTSGGLMDALWTFHTLNPGLRLEVEVSAVPLASGIRPFATASGIPAEAAWLGGAGEYELLAAAPEELDPETEKRWVDLGLIRIGRAVPAEGALVLHLPDGRSVPVLKPPPDPRAVPGIREHAAEVAAMASALFGGGRA